MDDDGERRDGGTGDIEQLVNSAMGHSVTPSRLHEAGNVGFFRRLIGQNPVEGPFTDDLDAGEQPHYLLHSTSMLTFPAAEDAFQDDHLELFDRSIISPVALIVTDERAVFIYGHGDTRRVISIPHSDVIDVEYTDMKVERELTIGTTTRRLQFRVWATDPYASELADVAAYIFEKSDASGSYHKHDFESDDYAAARATLVEQFHTMQGLSDQVDVEYVARCAVNGAKIGVYRSPYAAGVGFMLGAGYGIWSELESSEQTASLIDNIDPEATAEIMLRWQRAGQINGNRGTELASGAIGAALAIDSQTSGRRVSTALADLDVEWVSRQLESGAETDAALEVASTAIESYSTELAALLDEDFFEQLRKPPSEN